MAEQDAGLDSEVEADEDAALFIPSEPYERINQINDDLRGDRLTMQEAFPQVREALIEVDEREKRGFLQQSRKRRGYQRAWAAHV